MPTTSTTTRASVLAVLSLLACDPTHGQPVLGGSLLTDEPDSAEPEDETETSGDSSEPDFPEDDPPLLDLGTDPGDGDGGGEGEPLPEDPEPEPQPMVECTDHSDCSELTTSCTIGVCSPSGCEAVPYADGLECDLVDPCIVGAGQCLAGECTGGQAIDCSGLDSECTVGICDPETGECLAVDLDGCELPEDPEPECPIGAENCPCTGGGACDPGLQCFYGVCLEPGDNPACQDIVATIDGHDIYRVQASGVMSDQAILDACSSCGMATPCGSRPTTPDDGPNAYDYHWYSPECQQVIPPDSDRWTLHGVISDSLVGSPECEGPYPLGCDALIGSFAYTAGNNKALANGPHLGAKGIEIWGGWFNFQMYEPAPAWVNGEGGGNPNQQAYSDRSALCAAQ